MDIPGLIAWLAEDHPAAALLTTAPTAEQPARIQYANAAFEALSGYARHDVLGHSPRMLQGPRTDARAARLLAAAARAGRPARAVLLNYRRDGGEYLCEVSLQPVGIEGQDCTHLLGLAREVRRRRGRPAGEGLRFLPVGERLGLAAFARPVLTILPGYQAPAGAHGASRGNTIRPLAPARTTA